jgi:glycine oxidase
VQTEHSPEQSPAVGARYPDVVIIGGGVIGLATAYHLSAAGARVVVLEQRQAGGQASGAAAGIVEPLPGDSPLTALARASLALFRTWAPALRDETGIDIQLNRTGSLRLAFDEADAATYRATARHISTALGEPAEWLDAAALRAAEPALNPAARGALYYPDAYNVYSPRYVVALAAACRLRGVDLREGVVATGLRRQGDRVLALETTAGPVAGGQVVIAAGAWSAVAAAWFGLRVPVAPDRGQIMAVIPRGRPLRHVVHGGAGYAVPKADGLVVVGATHEDAGFDARVTVDGLAFLVDLARRLAPALADATLAHAWAGLRPALATGPTPLIGPLPGWRNAWLATGHGAWGITLSPGTGQLLAQALLGQPPAQDLTPFLPARLTTA